MTETYLLATRSADKVREIRTILAPARLISLSDAGIAESSDEDNIEVFDTFLQNAHAKAAYFRHRTDLPVIADDSGICVDVLQGAPGVRSRRFAADAPYHDDQDRANNDRLLHLLRDIAAPERTAHYTCVAVLHLPNGYRFSALGTCSGLILTQPRGSGGFGYDPLFVDPTSGLSFGEMPPDMKHRLSHRGRAFRALRAAF